MEVIHEGKSTTLQNDGDTVSAEPNYLPMVHRGPTYSSITDPTNLRDFLARPISVANGSFTTSQLRNDIIYNQDILGLVVNQPVWYDKLKGFRNIRANIRFRLVINAMPFQAGMVMLKWAPPLVGDLAPARTTNTTTSSQLPGVMVNFRDTMGECVVPYRSPYMYVNFFDTASSWGRVYIIIYSPLATGSGSETSCEYTLWMSMEDVELEVPMVPQSSTSKKVPRSKRVMRPVVSDTEANGGEGPVSKVLGGLGRVASGLGHIPPLAPLMGSVQWFMNAAQGFASSLGWSKPIVTSTPCRMVADRHAYHVNSNGDDTCTSIGLLADAEVAPVDDMGIEGVDEMSIAYIARKWCYAGAISWSTVQGTGVNLYYVEASPHSWRPSPFSYTGGGQTTTGYTPTPMGMITNLHRYYTGGVEVKLRFVKTDYHSGRLLVLFNPTTAIGVNFSNSPYAMREILDIREKDEVCFVLPYTSSKIWSASGQEVLGHFAIYVQTPMAAASTVNGTIDIIVEVRAAEDFSVAIPQYTKALPMVPQSGLSVEMDREMHCEAIGGTKVAQMTDESQYTMGECILSINQLCKRYTRVYLSSSTAGVPRNDRGYMYPYSLGAIRHVNTFARGMGPVVGDYLSLFGSMYAFWRGGIKVKTVIPSSDAVTIALLASPGTGSTDTGPWSSSDIFEGVSSGIPITSSTGNFAPNVIQPNRMMNGFSVQVPNYCPGRYRQCANVGFNSNTRLLFGNPDLTLNWSTMPFNNDVDNSTAIMYRAAGDDLQFGFFLGTVPTAYSTT